MKISKLLLLVLLLIPNISLAQNETDTRIIPENTLFGARFKPEVRTSNRTSDPSGTGAIWYNRSTGQWVGDKGSGLFTFGSSDAGATFPSQLANSVFSGPASGANASPTFRALVALDIPLLDASKISSGTISAARLPNLSLIASGLADGKCVRTFGGFIVAAADDCGAGSGDVVGPASAVNNRVVFFDGATGKLIKDSGLTLSGSNTGDQTITLTGDVTGSGTGSFATTIAADSVALGTDTTGNYVSGATANQGLLLTGTEGASLGFIPCAANEILKRNAGNTAWECAADSTGGAPAFNSITSGTNTTAAMVVGTGASLAVSGSGTIAATTSADAAAHIADATDAHAGTAITNTPAGNIAATTLQGAINELDTEKASLDGTNTWTGTQDFTGATVALNHSQLSNLNADDHAAVYTSWIENAGEPSAGSCPRSDSFHFNTTDKRLGTCYGTGENVHDVGDQGDSYYSVTDATYSANAVGGETITFAGSDSTEAHVFQYTSTFTNQPAGDGVEVLSSNAGDTNTLVIYGTRTGKRTGAFTSESITLTGTTPVSSIYTDWQTIIAAYYATSPVGTITIREASADQTIATLTGTTRVATKDIVIFDAQPQYSTKVVELLVFAPTTDVATGDGKVYYKIPSTFNKMSLSTVSASVITAGTTGTTDIQIAKCTAVTSGNTCSGTVVDLLTNKITIDSGESSSESAAVQPSITAANKRVVTGDILRIDVDAVNTTAPKGLIIPLEFILQ